MHAPGGAGIPDIIIDKFPKGLSWTHPPAIGGELHYGLDGMGIEKTLESRFLSARSALNQGGHFNCLPVPGFGRLS